MDAWRLLLGMSGILVLYAILVAVTGASTSPIQLAIAVLFGLVGLYIGRLLTDRLLPDRPE